MQTLKATQSREINKADITEEEERRVRERFISTITISAAIIAAVRLARDENISRPSPRLSSVNLARHQEIASWVACSRHNYSADCRCASTNELDYLA